MECGFGRERVILAGGARVSHFGWRGHFQSGAGVKYDGNQMEWHLVIFWCLLIEIVWLYRVEIHFIGIVMLESRFRSGKSAYDARSAEIRHA